MKNKNDYIEINKESWNIRTDIHCKSEFYDNKNFIDGKTSLNEIEINLLGDISNKSILHLQCHFGQDTISLNRLGAQTTGMDFSQNAIQKAKELAALTHSDSKFICCNIYDLQKHLNKTFDIIFTSYGVIGWLPDLDKWAKIINHFLKPKGRLVFVEFHPFIWMFDENFKKIKYNYFNSEPILELEQGTYTDRNAPIEYECVEWNHGLSEVINSLLENGLEIDAINEFDYSPYNCFNHTIEFEPGKFRIKHLENKIPMVYSICASKK